MKLYNLLRPLLFLLPPEWSHVASLQMLKGMDQIGLTRIFPQEVSQSCEVFGLKFKNPVGLAAGLDKNADYLDALASLGFGFIEIGTVTPKPQPGNPPPRLFRIPHEKALINALGFNSKGADYVVNQLKKSRYQGILGINIGKNKSTPLDVAEEDYLFGFRTFWRFASYITINISSPNTENLRLLEEAQRLKKLLRILKKEQTLIFEEYKKYVPLVIKISPDMSIASLGELAHLLLNEKMDGIIATNTTTHRDNVLLNALPHRGGLSGAPLQRRSTQTLKVLHEVLKDHIPIIASGGIMDSASANEKFKAGASLLQLYTGLIYQGPSLVREILLNKTLPLFSSKNKGQT